MRNDFPSTLHVGLEQDAMRQPRDNVSTWDYVHFGNVNSVADCTTDP